MRLVVPCPHDGRPIPLQLPARSWDEVPFAFNVQCPRCRSHFYFRRDQVVATPSQGAGVGGAAAGALLGLVAGPLGAIVGGVVGGGLGIAIEADERRQADRFNEARPR